MIAASTLLCKDIMDAYAKCRLPSSGLGPVQLRGVVISLLLLFVAESSRGMVVSTLYYYMLSVDNNDASMAHHFQPLAVSAFSLGRLIAAPIFGWAQDRWPVKWVVTLTIVISVLGHALYIFCGNITDPAAASCAIIAARALVGLGSGGSYGVFCEAVSLVASYLFRLSTCPTRSVLSPILHRCAGHVPRDHIPRHVPGSTHALFFSAFHLKVLRIRINAGSHRCNHGEHGSRCPQDQQLHASRHNLDRPKPCSSPASCPWNGCQLRYGAAHAK
jgi:hypothetical protein